MRRLFWLTALLVLTALPAAAEYGTWTHHTSDPIYSNAFIGISAADYDHAYMAAAWTNGIDTYRFIYTTRDGGASLETLYEVTLNLSPETMCEMLRITEARTSVLAMTPDFALFGGSGIDPECPEQFKPEAGSQIACIFTCSATLQPSIWYTDDGGATFQLADTPLDDGFGTVQHIFMVDDLVGYAGGLDSYFIKTTNGGYTWETMPPLYAPELYINYIHFLNEDEGWLAIGTWEPDEGKAMRELSGKALIDRQMHRMAMGVDPVYRREQLAKGDKPFIAGAVLHTTDGGMTWEILKQSSAEGYGHVWFIDSRNGFIVGDETVPGGYITKFYVTDDGGQSWQSYLSNFPAEIAGLGGGWAPEGISFANPGFGFMWGYGAKIASYGPVIFYTLDGGLNWQLEQSLVSKQAGQFTFDWVDNTTAYTAGLHMNVMSYQGTNVAPVADAGPDLVLTEGDTGALDGSGSSDADGDGLFYTWTQTDGVVLELDDEAATQPVVSATQVGTATFELTVNDGMYDGGPDTVLVTVNAAPPDDDTTDDDTVDDTDDDDTTDDDDDDNDDAADDDDDTGACGC
jgi:photosystem II stability/assembly factor-like uncharacterized protein